MRFLCLLLFWHQFYSCSVILFPIAITFYITWWFIRFVDGFFSPIYAQLGIDIFGMRKSFLKAFFLFKNVLMWFIFLFCILWSAKGDQSFSNTYISLILLLWSSLLLFFFIRAWFYNFYHIHLFGWSFHVFLARDICS